MAADEQSGASETLLSRILLKALATSLGQGSRGELSYDWSYAATSERQGPHLVLKPNEPTRKPRGQQIRYLSRFVAVSALSLVMLPSTSLAENHRGHHGRDRAHQNHQHGRSRHDVRHGDRTRGHRISHDDWARGRRIDYRRHRLRRPRRGYEWREVNGEYVLAAVTTGLISSIINASVDR